jgi:hypothetical protein
MLEFFKFACSDFWIFIGIVILLGIVCETPIKIFKYYFRSLNIKNHGWPPSHLDADGDFKQKDN